MEYIQSLIEKYRNSGVLLDTVLFVLLMFGSHDPRLIGRDKRLKQYVLEDLETLGKFLNMFSKVVTTPNILTEVSNLSGHLFETALPIEFIRNIDAVDEHYWPSKKAHQSDLFKRAGLTDSVIAHVAKGKYLILTDDLRLVGMLQKQRIDVINFNHIRLLNWQ